MGSSRSRSLSLLNLLRKGQARFLHGLLVGSLGRLGSFTSEGRLFRVRLGNLATVSFLFLETLLHHACLSQLLRVVLCAQILELLEALAKTLRVFTELLRTRQTASQAGFFSGELTLLLTLTLLGGNALRLIAR